MLRQLTSAFERFPYITQGLVAGGLHVVGDVIAQKYERNEKFDYRRTVNFTIVGFMTGMALRKWYGILDGNFSRTNRFISAINKVGGDIKTL